MRKPQKVYHDENYRDPPPVGVCEVCGCDIEAGEAYYAVDEGLVHADGTLERPEIVGRATPLSCIMIYIIQGYCENEVTAALGLERRGSYGA